MTEDKLLEQYKEDYIRACKTIADMHAAAMGEICGPKRGVVEDITDLKKERDLLISRANLFQNGDFTLHSGQKSKWKIECDALTKDDWATLALMAVKIIQPFCEVYGVPTGGIPFADALRPYCKPDASTILIAEDVVTTGGSIEKYLLQHHKHSLAYGVCVFARKKTASWITPLFQMGR